MSIAATTSAVYFLFLFVLHAGGLWRDETNTFNLASSSLAGMWDKLEYDSFPAFWPVAFGLVIKFGGTSDLFLRLLGALMGVGLIVCLWFNAFSLRYRLPLMALSLLMFCPSIILWGCSMRAYGIGMIAACLIYTLVWKYVEECSVKNLLLLFLVCLAGVHTLYYNAVVVLICILSGSAALLLERKSKNILLMGMVGFVSAVSMLVYAPVISRVETWSVSVKTDYTLSLFISKLHETLSPGGSLALWAWCLVIPVALTLGGKYLMESKTRGDIKMHARLLYPFLVLLLMVPAYFIFLKKLSYVTQPWYYFILMVIVAVSVDTILGILAKVPAINNGRLISAGLLLVSALFVCPPVISMRLTNIDLLSAMLNKDAKKQDLILVYPWWDGITFDRYYHGEAPWRTIPEISDHKLVHYDLIKEHMGNPDQAEVLRSTYVDIQTTLESGNTVFLLGEPMFPQSGQAVPVLPPAPQTPWGWQDGPYCITWSMQVADYLLKHSVEQTQLQRDQSLKVNPHENANLYLFKGWKD